MNIFLDHALTNDHAWSLSNKQLRIFDRQNLESDPKNSIQSHIGTFSPALGHLLYGGLDIVHRTRLRLDSIDGGGTWKAVFSKPDARPEQRYVVEFSGRWDSTAQRGFVERVTYVEQAYMPQYKGAHHDYIDWHLDRQTGLWVAGEMSFITASGIKERSVSWEAPYPVPKEGWDSLLAVPVVDGVDPIRGRHTFTSLVDFKAMERHDRSADGGFVVTPFMMSPTEEPFPWLRATGWAILGVLVIALIVVRRTVSRDGPTASSQGRKGTGS